MVCQSHTFNPTGPSHCGWKKLHDDEEGLHENILPTIFHV
jgi:hypothetical protein